jgi:PKD repeat protein
MKRLLPATICLAACTSPGTSVKDAAADRSSVQDALLASDSAVALAIDFTVESCPSFDTEALICTGNVPFTVQFVPLATPGITRYFWDFGDASPRDFQATPSHTYAQPGVYTVKLVASGNSGVPVTKIRTGFIVAQTNEMGQPCDSDGQCNQGLTCLCPPIAACGAGPPFGMCTSNCQIHACAPNQVCAGLLTAPPPASAQAAWQASLCLLGCVTDADCLPGLRCRTLPPGPAGSAWVHGCFADLPADIGDPCMDASGVRRNDYCASGSCLDLGSKGLCSMNCSGSSCPPGSDCAVLGDGRKVCLHPCIGDGVCTQDPLLTCVVPGPGDLGYRLAGSSNANAASSYCAPKPCVTDDACLPSGICLATTGGGHCARKPD